MSDLFSDRMDCVRVRREAGGLIRRLLTSWARHLGFNLGSTSGGGEMQDCGYILEVALTISTADLNTRF